MKPELEGRPHCPQRLMWIKHVGPANHVSSTLREQKGMGPRRREREVTRRREGRAGKEPTTRIPLAVAQCSLQGFHSIRFLRGQNWLTLARSLLSHRCHHKAFLCFCLLKQPLAEEKLGSAVPRMNSKSCVTSVGTPPKFIAPSHGKVALPIL